MMPFGTKLLKISAAVRAVLLSVSQDSKQCYFIPILKPEFAGTLEPMAMIIPEPSWPRVKEDRNQGG
jgi:hypothetical protein